MATDLFGRALRDHHLGEQDEPLIERDGDEAHEHPTEGYFEAFDTDAEYFELPHSWLDGPLLDIGAGTGKAALYFQEQFETIASEVSEPLIETMRERGVDDVRYADMFELYETFERDRFQSALVLGTHTCLAGSLHGLRQFLNDLAFVTTPDATAVLDSCDPNREELTDRFGYRDDPTPGLAHLVMHFEYEGTIGETLLFRLFSPDRLREATIGTDWEVVEISRSPNDIPYYYQAALEKRYI